MNINNSISTASRRGPSYGYRPHQGFRPQPMRPQQPYFPPQYGRPTYPMPMPMPMPYPIYRGPSVVSQVWHGATERLQELAQVALHPFNPYARRMPWDMYRPRTDAENVGRWAVNLGLLGGAVVLGGALLGNGFSLGGIGAAVGMS